MWVVPTGSYPCRSPQPDVPGRQPLPTYRPSLTMPSTSRGGARSGYEEYGFGPVLTRGQTLRHEFTFSNNSKQPIRLIRAAASTPCCSAIGPLPTNAIPPGGRCQIPAILKVLTNQEEKKRVVFKVDTDSREQPTLMYALTAVFCPEWEVGDVGDRPPALAVNRAGHHVIRVVSRRVGPEGESLPIESRRNRPWPPNSSASRARRDRVVLLQAIATSRSRFPPRRSQALAGPPWYSTGPMAGSACATSPGRWRRRYWSRQEASPSSGRRVIGRRQSCSAHSTTVPFESRRWVQSPS